MVDALEQGDFHALEHLAHSLKGVAGNIAANALYACCQTVESNAVKQKVNSAMLAQCQNELDRL